MKILIDGQTLLTPEINRGIGTYFKNVIEHVLENDFANDFYINSPSGPHLNNFSPWAMEKLSILDNPAYDIRTLSSKKNGAELYSDSVNNDIEKEGINLYWSPNALMDNVFLVARANADCRFAVTIFDLIVAVMEKHYAKHRSSAAMAIYREKLKQLESDYDLYFHISEHTKSDFISMLKVEDKMHVVTPLAVDKSFRPYPFPKVVAPIEYVLYPGGFDPRKNMDRAVEAFAELQKRYGDDERIRAVQLWIVCLLDSASKDGLLNRAKRLGLNGNVKLTGFVSDAALVELYQKARCLFFPSLYEGFGLPILEGLACGLPVACSNTSSLPEVGGTLAHYFDPYNIQEMADRLYRVLSEPMDYSSRLRRFEYSKMYSWQKTASSTLQAFADCICPQRTDSTVAPSTIMNNEATEEPLTEESLTDEPLIDVRKLMEELSVEELCQTAEDFFARLNNWDYLHAKPFAAINETPELLIGFAHVVQGLNLLPGMTILDFGAGSCWTSRFLSQLGLEVIAQDVSSSALRIGQELYKRQPLIGDQPAPRFLQFDGHRLDLPDESVDRISCWDAFHHVSNPEQVIKEMARVLKQGGIAGFSEPGPEHSKSPQSQYEMRTNRVVENDINVHEIWDQAQKAGFTDIKLAIFNPNRFMLPMEEFDSYLNGESAGERYLEETREQMKYRRVFFLFKGESSGPADSRRREGLTAQLQVEVETNRIAAGKLLHLKAVVTNNGANVWLPTTSRVGAVRFGVHLFDEKGILIDLDYFRQDLTPGEGREILPGEVVEITADVPMPSTGRYVLQFDLVSEAVCWFEHNGSPTVRFEVEVV